MRREERWAELEAAQQATADAVAAVVAARAQAPVAVVEEPKLSGTDIERLRISLGELEARHSSSGSTSSSRRSWRRATLPA